MARAHKINSLLVKPSTVTEEMVLTHSDSGRTFFLNSSGGFTITLPDPRGGINFEFVVKTAPTSDYVIYSADGTIIGQIFTSDTNAAIDSAFQNGGVSNIKFIGGISKVGDSIEIISDGTYWYANGFCSINNAIDILEDSKSPSTSPSASPSISPSISKSVSPSISKSVSPSVSPSASQSASPSASPSISPSISPSAS